MACDAGYTNLGDFLPLSFTECTVNMLVLNVLWGISLFIQCVVTVQCFFLFKQVVEKYLRLRKNATAPLSRNNNNDAIMVSPKHSSKEVSSSPAPSFKTPAQKDMEKKQMRSQLLIFAICLTQSASTFFWGVLSILKLANLTGSSIGVDHGATVIYIFAVTAFFVFLICLLAFLIRLQMKNAKVLDPAWARRLYVVKWKVTPLLTINVLLGGIMPGVMLIDPTSASLARVVVGVIYVNIVCIVGIVGGCLVFLLLLPLAREITRMIEPLNQGGTRQQQQQQQQHPDASQQRDVRQLEMLLLKTKALIATTFVAASLYIPFAFCCAFLPFVRDRLPYVLAVQAIPVGLFIGFTCNFLLIG